MYFSSLGRNEQAKFDKTSGNSGVGGAEFSVSRTGTVVYVPGSGGTATPQFAIGVADRAGTVTRLNVPPGSYEHVRASRDGKRLGLDETPTMARLGPAYGRLVDARQ